mmetsp:Transcript_8931/g.11614  ORF Transcript_8931/g.11614 Transcript_8931/m.11614 type:complete len:209 (-) Transcript_8931:147-773(-)
MVNIFSTKWIVSGSVGVCLLYFRNGFMVRLILGSGLNSVASKLLKRTFNLSRPSVAIEQGHDDPGFPSSHAHMLAFLASFLSLESRKYLQASGSGDFYFSFTSLFPLTISWSLVCTLLWLSAFFGGYLRVRMQRHTMTQVVAGFVSGSIGGYSWYLLQDVYREEINYAVTVANAEYPRATIAALVCFSMVGWIFLAFYGKVLSKRKES